MIISDMTVLLCGSSQTHPGTANAVGGRSHHERLANVGHDFLRIYMAKNFALSAFLVWELALSSALFFVIDLLIFDLLLSFGAIVGVLLAVVETGDRGLVGHEDACRTDGAAAVRHRSRGQPVNNLIHRARRDYVVTPVRERYADFGTTLAAEKLAEAHGIRILRETLREWKIEDDLWLPRQHRQA